MLRIAKDLLIAITSIIAPPECCVCGIRLFDNELPICKQCHSEMKLFKGERCHKCGISLPEAAANICSECSSLRSRVSFVVAVGPYDPPLSDMIRALKFQRVTAIAPKLSELLADVLWEDGRIGSDWIVVAVPLSVGSFRRRGFNQSELIARMLAKSLGLFYVEGALVKTRETREQAMLSRLYRLANLEGAFQAKDRLVKGRKVLLVDDITTTGATLEACAEALRNAGAAKVAAAVIAKTLADRRAVTSTEGDEAR
ncbi:MAG: hypothetical protein Kow00107_00710 [Planctomycetota bacterium]